MTSEHEANESFYKHADSIYGKYEGNQESAHQQHSVDDGQLSRADAAGKVHVSPHSNKNILNFIVGVLAMVTIIIVAVLCAVFGGGAVGWIGVGITSIGIFLVAATTIEKIQ